MAQIALQWPTEPSAPRWLSGGTGSIAQMTAALNSKTHRERWKYTKATPILAMLPLAATAPDWHTLPEGVNVQTFAAKDDAIPLIPNIEDAPEACAALCYQSSVEVMEVRGEIDKPILINHAARTLPLVIKLQANASLDLREVFEANANHQVQTLWLELGPGSRLTHSRNCFSQGQHWQYLRVHVDRDATYTLHNHNNGTTLRRQDIQIICAAPGAHAQVTSAAFVGKGQHLDQQITVEHTAPISTSKQTFHNIGADQAKVTFNGRIHIHKNCGGVDATLSNKNLSVGDGTVFNTKPELEIYTDDVKCAHGATVGQLDESHLFYCTSRGIPLAQARSLLSQAFLHTATTGPLADQAQQYLSDQFTAQSPGHQNV
jgi:SUF system for Fe-S cluster assembly SufBD-like protein